MSEEALQRACLNFTHGACLALEINPFSKKEAALLIYVMLKKSGFCRKTAAVAKIKLI